MTEGNAKNPLDKEFILTKEYCQKYGDCNYAGCCLLYMAIQKYAIESISFSQQEDYSGCAHVQELKWNRERDREEARIKDDLTLKQGKGVKPRKQPRKG